MAVIPHDLDFKDRQSNPNIEAIANVITAFVGLNPVGQDTRDRQAQTTPFNWAEPQSIRRTINGAEGRQRAQTFGKETVFDPLLGCHDLGADAAGPALSVLGG